MKTVEVVDSVEKEAGRKLLEQIIRMGERSCTHSYDSGNFRVDLSEWDSFCKEVLGVKGYGNILSKIEDEKSKRRQMLLEKEERRLLATLRERYPD